MEKWAQSLIQVLEDEQGIIQKLLEIAGRKKDIVIQKDTAGLDGCLNTERPLLMQMDNLEKRRCDILRDAGMEGMSLRAAADKADAEGRKAMTELLESMRDNFSRLKRENDRNTQLVKEQMRYFNMLEGAMRSCYGVCGEKETMSAGRNGLMDKKV